MRGRGVLVCVLLVLVPGVLSASAAPASGPQTYADTVKSDAPVGYWRLGEEFGAETASDASGKGFHGSYGTRSAPGAPGAIAGDLDTAVALPGGSDSGVTVGSQSLYLEGGDFTVEAWVRTDTPTPAGAKTDFGLQGDRAIASKATGIEPICRPNPDPMAERNLSGPGWAVAIADDQALEGRVRAIAASSTWIDDLGCPQTSSLSALGPATRVDDGRWHHVVVVFQASEGITIYVDGESATTGGTLPPMDSNVPRRPTLLLGSLAGAPALDGTLDEVAVYQSALSAARVQARLDVASRGSSGSSPAGDKADTPGVVHTGSGVTTWALTNDFAGTISHSFSSICCGAVLAADWDGDGISSPAVVEGNVWTFTHGYDDLDDLSLTFGDPGSVPVAGDWNGDGIDTPGAFNGTSWSLSDGFAGTIDHAVTFGQPGDVPVVGDWNGDGLDTIGVRRGSTWYLSDALGSTVTYTVELGQPEDAPVTGDWNADGRDTIGVRRGTVWHLSDDLSGTVHREFAFGPAGGTAVAGDWDSEAVDDAEQLDGSVTLSLFAAKVKGQRFAATATPDPVFKYAPVVYLNEPTAGFGRYNPASVYYFFIRRSSLRFAVEDWFDKTIRGRGRIKAGRLGDRTGSYYYATTDNTATGRDRTYATWEFTRPKDESHNRAGLDPHEGFFLDLRNQDREGMTNLDEVPVYYDYAPKRYIRYWFFFPYSIGQAGFNHEGDWEGFTVRLNASNVATDVWLDRHKKECGELTTWDKLEIDPAGTGRKVLFSARGSHGTYKEAAQRPLGSCGDDWTARGVRWATWTRIGNVRKQSWYGFGGAWGEVGDFEVTTGPLGPSRYKRGVPLGW